MTPSELQGKFPADPVIQNRDDDALQATIDAVLAETNGYTGITNETIRNQAIALHVAHYTRMESILESTVGVYGVPSRVKSRNDEIEYTAIDGRGYSSTLYGQRLEKLLESQYAGGFCL